MALPFKINRDHLPATLRFFGVEGFRFLRDRLLGRDSRAARALAYVKEAVPQGDPEGVLRALDHFGREHSFLMNVGDRKGELLARTLQESDARLCLEIGAFCGYSAVLMGRILAERDGRLISLEASRENHRISQEMVAWAGLADTVDLRHGSAEALIPELEGPFDLVFIDHWKDLYLPDLERIEKHDLLREGSIVVADNVGFFDAEDYLTHVRTCGHYDSTNYPLSVEYRDDIPDAVEISVYRADTGEPPLPQPSSS